MEINWDSAGIGAAVAGIIAASVPALRALLKYRLDGQSIEERIRKDGLERVVAHLSQELEAVKKEHAAEVSEIRAEVQALKLENNKLRQEHTNCQIENAQMRIELKHTNERVSDLQAQLNAHREKHRKPGEPETTTPQPSPLLPPSAS